MDSSIPGNSIAFHFLIRIRLTCGHVLFCYWVDCAILLCIGILRPQHPYQADHRKHETVTTPSWPSFQGPTFKSIKVIMKNKIVPTSIKMITWGGDALMTGRMKELICIITKSRTLPTLGSSRPENKRYVEQDSKQCELLSIYSTYSIPPVCEECCIKIFVF